MRRRSTRMSDYDIKRLQNLTEYLIGIVPEDIKVYYIKIVQILRKPIEKKTEDNIFYLMSQIEHHDFFTKQKTKAGINGDQSLLYSCAKCLDFECFAKGEIVCLEGEASDRFFVILDGAVNIFLPKDSETFKKELAARKLVQPNIQKKIETLADQIRVRRKSLKMETEYRIADKESDLNLMEATDYVTEHELGGLNIKQIPNQEKLFQDGIFLYRYSGTLTKGAIFGELGLIRNKPRAATIICQENTYFATMSKVNYDNILKVVEDNKFAKKINFFVNNLFKDCSRDKIAKVCYDFEKVKFNYKQIIYKEYQEPQSFYLLYNGSVKVHSPFLTKEFIITQPKKNFLGKSDVLNFMRSTENEKIIVVQISDITSGQCFGEDDLLNERLTSVNAISMSHETKAYKINKNDNQILKVIKERVAIKEDWRNKQLQMHKDKLTRDDPKLFQSIFGVNPLNISDSKQIPQLSTLSNINKSECHGSIRLSARELSHRIKIKTQYTERAQVESQEELKNSPKQIIQLSQKQKKRDKLEYIGNLEKIIKYNQQTFSLLKGDSDLVIDFKYKDQSQYNKSKTNLNKIQLSSKSEVRNFYCTQLNTESEILKPIQSNPISPQNSLRKSPYYTNTYRNTNSPLKIQIQSNGYPTITHVNSKPLTKSHNTLETKEKLFTFQGNQSYNYKDSSQPQTQSSFQKDKLNLTSCQTNIFPTKLPQQFHAISSQNISNFFVKPLASPKQYLEPNQIITNRNKFQQQIKLPLPASNFYIVRMKKIINKKKFQRVKEKPILENTTKNHITSSDNN